jgi:hypothetical protein
MKWRGKLVVLEMMMNIFGFMTVNWINYGLSYAGGALEWRLPLALQLIFIFVLFATVPWLPESPRSVIKLDPRAWKDCQAPNDCVNDNSDARPCRWLIAHGRVDDATQILADLENTAIDDPYIVAEREEIIYSVEYERKNAIRWRDLIRGRTQQGTRTIRRLTLGAGSQFMQQFGYVH